jgi:hypothetical protein
MPETKIWNRGGAPREFTATGDRSIFVTDRRESSFAALILATICGGLAGGVFLFGGSSFPFPCGVIFGVIFGTFGLILVIVALIDVWTQVAIEVDPRAREIALVTKSPFRLRRTAYALARVRRIGVHLEKVDSAEDGTAEPEMNAKVWLDIDNTIDVVLCTDEPDKATAFARRLASLIGVPCM